MNPAEARGFLRLEIDGEPVLPRIRVADRFLLRGLGLMGRKKIPRAYGTGLFFPNCGSLHGFFMRFELEVWFLDEDGQPIGGPRRLKPWRIVTAPRTARHCMEISQGTVPITKGSWEWNRI